MCNKNSKEIIPLSVSPIWEEVKSENNYKKEKNEKEKDEKEKATVEKIGKFSDSDKTEKNEMEGKKGGAVSTDTKSKSTLKLKLPPCVSYDKCFQGF